MPALYPRPVIHYMGRVIKNKKDREHQKVLPIFFMRPVEFRLNSAPFSLASRFFF